MRSFEDEFDAAMKLADKINRCYKKYGVDLNIREKDIDIVPGRYMYRIKLKAGTRVSDIKRLAQDVQIKLKLELFEVVQREVEIFIVACSEKVGKISRHFYGEFLNSNEEHKNMGIAHLVGINSFGQAVIKDLTLYPHVFVAGTTGSGKTVGLKNILISTAFKYAPDKVQILIGDMADGIW